MFIAAMGEQGKLLAHLHSEGVLDQTNGDVVFLNRVDEVVLKLKPSSSNKQPTGNEGTEFELQYLNAAIIVQRKKST